MNAAKDPALGPAGDAPQSLKEPQVAESSVQQVPTYYDRLNATNIILTPEPLLQSNLKLSLFKCRKLKQSAAETAHPLQLIPASNLCPHSRLTTGCKLLDSVLGGGVPMGGITELSGRSASGKTQFCLQLSLTAQWPVEYGGLASSGVLYICTEDRFPSTRLQQLIKCFPSPTNFPVSQYGDNIFIEQITHDPLKDLDMLWECVNNRAPQLMLHRKVRLIVLDSAAMIFRSHLEDGAAHRAKLFRNLIKQLTYLSVKHQAVVVCVNQVAQVPSDDGDETEEVPALGLSWANLMHTKLLLSRDHEGMRHLEVMSSSEVPNRQMAFDISHSGLRGYRND
jgi:DNA-repair protein XRCC3